MVRVRIDTEAEFYPCVTVDEIGNPRDGEGVDIPRSVLTAYNEACEALMLAEEAVLRAAGIDPDAL
jgi:hypothetical protein